MEPLDDGPFQPLYNPEPDPDNLRFDNLNHLKCGLYPHEQHKKVKFIYTGPLKLDSIHCANVNLVTFDTDQ